MSRDVYHQQIFCHVLLKVYLVEAELKKLFEIYNNKI